MKWILLFAIYSLCTSYFIFLSCVIDHHACWHIFFHSTSRLPKAFAISVMSATTQQRTSNSPINFSYLSCQAIEALRRWDVGLYTWQTLFLDRVEFQKLHVPADAHSSAYYFQSFNAFACWENRNSPVHRACIIQNDLIPCNVNIENIEDMRIQTEIRSARQIFCILHKFQLLTDFLSGNSINNILAFNILICLRIRNYCYSFKIRSDFFMFCNSTSLLYRCPWPSHYEYEYTFSRKYVRPSSWIRNLRIYSNDPINFYYSYSNEGHQMKWTTK